MKRINEKRALTFFQDTKCEEILMQKLDSLNHTFSIHYQL